MWQELIVTVCVALAAIAVVRRMLPGRRANCASGCSGCGSQTACSSSTPSASSREVNIESHAIEIQPSSGA